MSAHVIIIMWHLIIGHKPMYHIAGKFGEFGELSVIRQTATIQISIYN